MVAYCETTRSTSRCDRRVERTKAKIPWLSESSESLGRMRLLVARRVFTVSSPSSRERNARPLLDGSFAPRILAGIKLFAPARFIPVAIIVDRTL